MFWVGTIFLILGLLAGLFKYMVVRNAARDIYNGGGAPVMDFVIFWPGMVALGLYHILDSGGHRPFSYFGFVAYVLLALACYGIMQNEYRMGKPLIEAQLKQILARTNTKKSSEE